MAGFRNQESSRWPSAESLGQCLWPVKAACGSLWGRGGKSVQKGEVQLLIISIPTASSRVSST